MPRIELTTYLAAPRERCFEASLSVDGHTSSMARSGERAVAGVTSGVLGPGDEVTWRARHFGLPFTMRVAITAHEAPGRFVDEQVAGPFRRWRHEHLFAQSGTGTVMIDVVEFASPVGPIGRCVDALVLTRYFTRLLQQRNAWLAGEMSEPDAGTVGGRP